MRNEAILLNVLNKSIYEGPVTDNTIPKLLVLWSKQEADPERFKFPFAIPKDGNGNVCGGISGGRDKETTSGSTPAAMVELSGMRKEPLFMVKPDAVIYGMQIKCRGCRKLIDVSL